ncbi:MAG: PAS domain S-box protein [Proteobacteria bacterium]|nr:PAS domain S-box protein [Pseudomonadota bacterium]
MNIFIILSIIGVYIVALFLIAFYAGRDTPALTRLSTHPIVYALSIAVYCTSWTFYGSVGKAATSGLSFLPIYLGPTLAICLWWFLLRRLIRIKNRFRITSIADFISARYEKSSALACLVTLMALIGTMPYIALQFKAIKSTFIMIAIPETTIGFWISAHFGPFMVLLMAAFTILFGVRKLDSTERHRGMITAIAAESLIKLTAFLACGIYVTYVLADGFSDIFDNHFFADPDLAAITSVALTGSDYITWATLLILSMSAIMFLPRQFHVAVVEAPSEKSVLTAMWVFPLYMLAINIFVLPIAAYGLQSGLSSSGADMFMLQIPLLHGHTWLAFFVFIGGFSAATSMVMISAMTMSTMAVNHLLLPLFNMSERFAPMRQHLLHWRWVAVVLIISLGYWFETQLGDSYALVNMGLISFAAALQFAPATLGALLWKAGSKKGAMLGLLAGFLVWSYTLLLPAFIKSGWLSPSLLTQGPWGIELLRPEALLGLTALPSLAHSVFWSMLANISAFLFGSILLGQSEQESRIALEFVTIVDRRDRPHSRINTPADIDLEQKRHLLKAALLEYLDEETSEAILIDALMKLDAPDREHLSVVEFSELHRNIETSLAGSIGAAMAHRVLNRQDIFTPKEKQHLSTLYAELLSSMNVSPQELTERINFYQERETLLTTHSRELELRIMEKEREIAARVKAEQALMATEQKYRSIFDNALEGIFQLSPAGQFLMANPAMATILGYDSPQLLIENVADIRQLLPVPPKRYDLFMKKLRSGYLVENFEIQAVHTRSATIWLSLNARPSLDQAGQLMFIEGIAEDITKRKTAEEKLQQYQEGLEEQVRTRTAEVRENQVFLQEVLDGIQASILVVRRSDTVILDCNSIAEKMLQSSRKELISKPASALGEALFSNTQSQADLANETLLHLKDGTILPVLVNKLLVVYKGELAHAIIFFDIRERKALERQANMAQKLQSIGQLAAGIAHEINTPIQYIGSNVSFVFECFHKLNKLIELHGEFIAQTQKGEDLSPLITRINTLTEDIDLPFLLEEIPQALAESKSGVEQVATIVKAIKQFAHPDEGTIHSIDVNQALEQTATVSRNEWKLIADVVFHLDKGAPHIKGYPGPLNQVFLNILVNASHAIREKNSATGNKGIITITTTGREDGLTIRIEDTGTGIAPGSLGQIFDPFFTTKEVGKGTGQGLSISYSIITEKHHGTIEVESELGSGTAFIINLPLGEE